MVDLGRRRDEIFRQQGITFAIADPDGAEQPGAPVPARPRAADHPGRRVGADRARPRAAPAGARTRSSTTSTTGARSSASGSCPWELVLGSPQFRRAVHGVRPPGGIYCHVSGCDLVRDADGTWRVLEDNCRTPSGISYVLENRARDDPARAGAVHRLPRAAGRPLPAAAAQRAARDRPGGGARPDGRRLDARRRRTAPTSSTRSSPGRWASSWSRPGTSSSATTSVTCAPPRASPRVDAIYRRLDDDFIDPLEFRPDSLLGVPGLIRAYRAGTVALANAVGTGVADDKAVYAFVPEMIRYYLGEEPLLDNVRTYLLRDPEQLEYVLDRLDRWWSKPTGESGGKGVYIGPRATDEETARQRRAARGATRERWIAQEVVAAVDDADRDRDGGELGAAPRRPAPVRGLRLGAADHPRRADAGRARRGRDDRQLLARRRLEGHLGALRGRPGAACPPRRGPADAARHAGAPPLDLDRAGTAAAAGLGG